MSTPERPDDLPRNGPGPHAAALAESDSSQRSGRGFVLVLAGTALVGLIGYFITWLVPRVIGVERYATFAVFWASIFLVAAALSGIQQEITRATTTTRAPSVEGRHRARNFALVAAVACVVLVGGSSPLWAGAVFRGQPGLVPPLVVGCGMYVIQATIGGTLYGRAWWPGVFTLIATEGIARLALICIALIFTTNVTVLAWMVIVPFPITILVVVLLSRRRSQQVTTLDVGYRQLSLNVLRTVVASASMGVLVSGFPLLLQLTSRNETAAQLGTVILTATLTRAPLIVVGMALQSYFVLLFRTHLSRMWRLLSLLLACVLVLGVALAALGWWLGPTLLSFLFPNVPMPPAWFIAALIATSCLVGALCIVAPAVLAGGAHTAFGAGWLTAAASTLLVLLLPLPLYERTIAALAIGPALGLVVFLISVSVTTSARSRQLQHTASVNPSE